MIGEPNLRLSMIGELEVRFSARSPSRTVRSLASILSVPVAQGVVYRFGGASSAGSVRAGQRHLPHQGPL